MAKRESIWKANDGTEHRGKQSAAVADARHSILHFIARTGCSDFSESPMLDDDAILANADELQSLLDVLIKARAALAKHEAKGE